MCWTLPVAFWFPLLKTFVFLPAAGTAYTNYYSWASQVAAAEFGHNHQTLLCQSSFCHTALATALTELSMWQWKGLCHLFGFMHKCHPSLRKSLFPHPKITILDRDWIVNKYPKNTQKRSWLFFPSMTSKQVSHSNKQEKNLINISFLLVIHISMLLVFWQLHLKVLKISK